MSLDAPEVLAEVRAASERYETALSANDTAVLDELFWHDPRVLRWGAGESLYGIDAIRTFRAARSSSGLARTPTRVQITAFGTDLATVHREFQRHSDGRIGRQSQTWARLPEGWRVVAAHISTLDAPGAAPPA